MWGGWIHGPLAGCHLELLEASHNVPTSSKYNWKSCHTRLEFAECRRVGFQIVHDCWNDICLILFSKNLIKKTLCAFSSPLTLGNKVTFSMPVVVACAGWGKYQAATCPAGPALFGGARAGPGPRLQTGPGRPGLLDLRNFISNLIDFIWKCIKMN